MAWLKSIKRVVGPDYEGLSFMCPGCGDRHRAKVAGKGSSWGWNGSLTKPTFTPSMLVRSGHYLEGGGCWCKYNAEHPEKPAPFTCYICHSFVTDGCIQFLGDCTHALAGQTVDLPEMPTHETA